MDTIMLKHSLQMKQWEFLLSGDYYDTVLCSHDATLVECMMVLLGYFEDLTGGITRCNRAIIELGGEDVPIVAPVVL